ncbi:MAG TPA: orotidine 5'-phosphate decarboxylase [Candidatus Dojkabacteria bacterium]|nr:orotidine 5'-phosphate decarboxylase [Candidatus Dojkabacteria bacterium]
MSGSNKYLQLAFNSTLVDFYSVVSQIPRYDNIIIEAGTPLIKREGTKAIAIMKRYWPGEICADIKVVDGAREEVLMAKEAGASYITALGNASKETLQIFVNTCKEVGIKSVIDMINTPDPLKSLWRANIVPDVVTIHRGRDEENSFGKVIQYKNISKIKGKWDILVGAAGGIDQKEMHSAAFNGADIVVVNVVRPNDPWGGLVMDRKFNENISNFIALIK